MKVGDLLKEASFPELGHGALARARREGARRQPPSRTRWCRAPTTASASNRWRRASATRVPRGMRADPPSPWAVDAAHRRSRSRRAPTGRRWRTSTRARPAWRWSSRARRTRSATDCRRSRKRWRSRSTTCRSTASISGSTCIRRAAPASTGWSRCWSSAASIRPSSACPSASIRPRSSPAPAGCRMSIEALKASMPQSLAHFFALGLPGILLEGDGRVFHNAGATEAQELGIVLASAVSHLRMFEEARQALVYAAPHIGFSLGRRPGPVRLDRQAQGAAHAVGARRRRPARSRRPRVLGSCRDVLPDDDGEGPGDQHPAQHDRGFRGGRRRRRFDLRSCRTRSRTACRTPSRGASPATRSSILAERKPCRFRRRSRRRLRQRRER